MPESHSEIMSVKNLILSLEPSIDGVEVEFEKPYLIDQPQKIVLHTIMDHTQEYFLPHTVGPICCLAWNPRQQRALAGYRISALPVVLAEAFSDPTSSELSVYLIGEKEKLQDYMDATEWTELTEKQRITNNVILLPNDDTCTMKCLELDAFGDVWLSYIFHKDWHTKHIQEHRRECITNGWNRPS